MPCDAMAEHLKQEEILGEPNALGKANTQRLTILACWIQQQDSLR